MQDEEKHVCEESVGRKDNKNNDQNNDKEKYQDEEQNQEGEPGETKDDQSKHWAISAEEDVNTPR